MATTNEEASVLLRLPAELLLHVLAYLEPFDLAHTARTCKTLASQAYDDLIWQPLINANLPNDPITDPSPLASFRELYIAHHPYWFLTKHRLWFGDSDHQGKLVAARYDPRHGCIEAYTVAAQRGPHTLQFWEKDREVIIHSFNPKIKLDLQKPVLKLELDSLRTDDQPNNEPSDRAYAPPSKYSKEIIMNTFSESGLFSSFMLCRSLPSKAIGPTTAIWPPLRLPAPERVRNNTQDGYQSSGHRPTTFSEISQHHFRLRKWVEYTGRRGSPNLLGYTSPNGLSAALGIIGPYFAAGYHSTAGNGMNYRMPEDITTFATLPSDCWEPTPQKPWQGLWCGDYSGHGCEFLVILQPDKKDERPLPEGMNWLRSWFNGGPRAHRRESESSEESFESAQEDLDEAELADAMALERASLRESEESISVQTAAQLQAMAVLEGFTEPVAAAPVHYHAQPSIQSTTNNENDPREGSSRNAGTTATDYPDAPSGRLEAIKLTGDPNIPRGEYTFIAPDIGHGGFLRVADEEIFRGARVVRSAGHIAGRGFQEDQYTPSQLIMISHDRVAQFWEGFGHVSYYQRVDVGGLMGFRG